MKKQNITIHDIAKELNVSASTVSRALQNHPRISIATRDSVKKLAEKYNYQPNVVASSLRRGKSNTVRCDRTPYQQEFLFQCDWGYGRDSGRIGISPDDMPDP